MPPEHLTIERTPWWKGSRGEWLVVAQIALIGLVFLGPRTIAGRPDWPFPFPQACALIGPMFMIAGMALLVSGLVRLGPGLTPLPFPKDDAGLVQTGPYAIVRHPVYCGGLTLALGWALCAQSWLTVGYVAVLFAFLDVKSRREETWLSQKYPEYRTYQQRVHKLIPFVY